MIDDKLLMPGRRILDRGLIIEHHTEGVLVTDESTGVSVLLRRAICSLGVVRQPMAVTLRDNKGDDSLGIRTAVSDLLGLRLGESILFDQGSSVIEVTREEDPEGPYWETKDMETGERQTWSIMLELADWLEGR